MHDERLTEPEQTAETADSLDKIEDDAKALDEVAAEPGESVETTEAAPNWFKKQSRARKARRAKKRAAALPKIEVVEEEEEALPFQTRAIRWLKSLAAYGYYASFFFHFVITLMLIWMISPIESDNEPFGINASMDEIGTGEDEEFEEAAPAEMALEVSPNSEPEQTPAEKLDVFSMLGTEAGVNPLGEIDFKMPAGGNAVTKGSFTVWTVPEDPQPGQQYRIVIQVRLPDKVRKYDVGDLSGVVIGTDEYRQLLPVDPRKPFYSQIPRGKKMVTVKKSDRLPVKDHQVQLYITIPGADRLVKDTIEIRSKLLDEEQSLELVF